VTTQQVQYRARLDPITVAWRRAFAAAVHLRRKQLRLTQPALAERAGCDRQSISRVENAHYSPSLDRVFLLAAALDLTPAELFTAVDDTFRAGGAGR
jgi:transcriptional regulator with XRE-family HTH domain